MLLYLDLFLYLLTKLWIKITCILLSIVLCMSYAKCYVKRTVVAFRINCNYTETVSSSLKIEKLSAMLCSNMVEFDITKKTFNFQKLHWFINGWWSCRDLHIEIQDKYFTNTRPILYRWYGNKNRNHVLHCTGEISGTIMYL